VALERGFDISGNQSATNATVLARWKDPLYTFVGIKATEGERFDDPVYLAHLANARAALKRILAYHFAWCSNDPLVEAAHFVKTANLQPGMLGCLDAEDWGPKDANGVRTYMVGITWAMRVDWMLRFLREVNRLTGLTLLVYMNWNWIKGVRTASTTAQWAELCTYPLWLADVDSGIPGTYPTVNPKVTGGPTLSIVMHQWTANEGGLDGDAMNDPAAWTRYAMPQKEMFTVAQFDDLMGAITALTARVTALETAVGKTAPAADLTALRTDVGNNQRAVIDALDQLPDDVGAKAAAVVQPAITAAIDSTLGGVQITATYVRQKEVG